MKTLILLFALAGSLAAQLPIYGSRDIYGNLRVLGSQTQISVGTTLPATCTVASVFFKSDATAGQNLYGCTATNTWTQQTGGASGTVSYSTGTANPSDPCSAGSLFTNTANDTYWLCNGTLTWSQIITDGGSWVNPVWLTSLAFSKITGITTKGNTTTLQLFGGGSTATNDCAKFDANGNIVSAGAACGAGGGSISGLTTRRLPKAASSTSIDDSNVNQETTGTITMLKSLFGQLNSMAFSATPAFDLSLANTIMMTLTGNVTSSTVANAPASGTVRVTHIMVQDAPGGRTVAWPTSYLMADAPDPNPSAVTIQEFDYNGTNYLGKPSRCVANCSSGFSTYSGKTSGSGTIGAADAAGTPARINLPTTTGAANGVLQTDGSTPQQTSWQASTGTGNIARATSPTFVTPALGTPSAAVLTNATGLPLATGITGTLPVANGGTGATSFTGSRCVETNAGGTAFVSASAACGSGGSSTWSQPFVLSADGAGVLSGRIPLVSVNSSTGNALIGTGAAAISSLSLPLAGTGMIGVHMHLDSSFVTGGTASLKLFTLTGAAETITWSIAFGCMSAGMANSTAIATNTASTPAILQNNNTWTQITVTGIVTTGCDAGERAVLTIAHAASTNDVYLAGGLVYQ